MLQWLEGRVSSRKFRLFACACCRRIWHLLTDERSRTAVEVAEQFADGRATKSALASACGAAYWCWHRPSEELTVAQREAAIAAYSASLPTERTGSKRPHSPLSIAHRAWGDGMFNAETRTSSLSVEEACIAGATLVREIFGNPFRPVVLSPGWCAPAVLALAQATYDNRTLPAGTLEPERLAVLADALEEAGCTDADILGHLRGPGLHYRGCWCVDTLLNKS
jgi:hypothetical protein